MRAAVLERPMHFAVREIPIPVAGPGEILVRVDACGVCRSDFYNWEGQSKSYPLDAGAPGHEICGTVAAVGPGVEDLVPGDRVTTITLPGRGYAEYALAEERLAARVPDRCSGKVILGEPLACAVNAMRRSGTLPGDSVLLLGVGFMGALALKILRLMGAAPLMAADVFEFNRELAAKNGADAVLAADQPGFIDEVLRLTEGRGADVVVEATGAQAALDAATEAVRIKGTIVVYGYHVGGNRSINMRLWNWKGINVVNGHERDSMVYAQGMRKGLELIKHGRLVFDLVTNEHPLHEIQAVFESLRDKRAGFIKAVVKP